MKRIRILSLILASVLLLGTLVACGSYEPSDNPKNYNHANPTLQKINDLESDVSFRVENRLEENDWTDPAQNNVSTFSADVDTASYTLFRRLVNSGISMSELLEEYAGWFRTEEMVNYFRYNYAEPASADDLFGVTRSVFTCPWDNEKALLVLGFAADSTVPETAGNNYVFLIDVSGSMASADKLPLLKNSLNKLANTLGPDDLVSIVTYASKEEVVCEGCSAGEKDKILNAIEALRASGSTNGEKGIQTAYEIAEKYFIEGGNNRIILCSDGDLNVGISNTEDLKAFISEKKTTGVYLSVLGFGTGNYRDSVMETLADNGNGAYYYIDGEDEADKVFGTDLASTLYTVAEDVKFQMTFNKDYVTGYRLIGYENRLLNEEDFTDDSKDAGEIGAGHQLTVLYELTLSLPDSADYTFADLAIRWKKPGETESNLQEEALKTACITDSPSADARFAALVAEATLMMRGSEFVVENRTLQNVSAELGKLTLSETAQEFRNLISKVYSDWPADRPVGGITYHRKDKATTAAEQTTENEYA